MAEPGKAQEIRQQGTDEPKVSDPTNTHIKADESSGVSEGKRHGIPEELSKAGGDEGKSKSLPISDREGMETAVTKQKP
jgi:hypothetical protein